MKVFELQVYLLRIQRKTEFEIIQWSISNWSFIVCTYFIWKTNVSLVVEGFNKCHFANEVLKSKFVFNDFAQLLAISFDFLKAD